MSKIKVFTGKKDAIGNAIRLCPSCKQTLYYDDANRSNPINEAKWNNKILGFLCCLCAYQLKLYNKNVRIYNEKLQFEITRRDQALNSRYNQCNFLRCDLGLRKLGLIE